MLDFSGITLGIKASDVLSAGVGLFGLIALFVLLGLGFPIAKKIIGLVRASVGNGSTK